MARRKVEEDKIDTGRWLLTYSDIMNNLLVLFVVLYAMSLIDLEKFKSFAQSFGTTLGGTSTSQFSGSGSNSSGSGGIPGDTSSGTDKFDELYQKVTQAIKDQGYENEVVVEKGENYVHFRFKDSVLFYPDSAAMKKEGYNILQYVGTTIQSVDNLLESIDIGGHTAQVAADSTTDFFSWELSSDRAMTVLKFLVQDCGLPQSKMTVSGYSHYSPVSDNNSEEGRSLNRRVEIRITKMSK